MIYLQFGIDSQVPVLRAQDLTLMAQFSDDPDTGLQKLEKVT